MQPVKTIKRRIKSVNNVAQITKAMEVVSMTKMRKSQAFALAGRPYAIAALSLLRNLKGHTKELPEIMQERKVAKSLLIVIASDKGLVGGFNDAVLRAAEKWVAEKKSSGAEYYIYAVGKKAKDYFERRKVSLLGSVVGAGDFCTPAETGFIGDEIVSGFMTNRFDQVDAVSMNFRSTLKQVIALKNVLPVKEATIEEAIKHIAPEWGKFSGEGIVIPTTAGYNFEYIFEPSPEDVLQNLAEKLVRVHIHHIILESNASEHSARMMAMKNASENADELISSLTLAFNTARQSGITSELNEIVSGMEALQS